MAKLLNSDNGFVFEEIFTSSINIEARIKQMYGKNAQILRIEKKNRGLLSFLYSPKVKVTVCCNNKEEDINHVEKKLLLGKVQQIYQEREAPSLHAKDNKKNALFDMKKLKGLHANLQMLEQKGFLPSILDDYQETMLHSLTFSQLQDSEYMKKTLFQYLETKIPILPTREFFVDNTRIIACLGPTGMGKTTSIIKFAVKFLLSLKTERNGAIDIISLDYFKIGGDSQIEKFKTFMHNSNAEFKEKLNFQSMSEAGLFHTYIRKKKRGNVLLIDTAGRSVKEQGAIDIYRPFFEVQSKSSSNIVKKCIRDHLELFLVIATNTSAIDMRNIIDTYASYDIHGIIATKFDDTVALGTMLSICIEKNIPLAYISQGQDLKKDFEHASTDICFKHLGIKK